MGWRVAEVGPGELEKVPGLSWVQGAEWETCMEAQGTAENWGAPSPLRHHSQAIRIVSLQGQVEEGHVLITSLPQDGQRGPDLTSCHTQAKSLPF